ncbi:MAG: hypothetical protein U1E42_15500 [Rhodospirillales bacterium]
MINKQRMPACNNINRNKEIFGTVFAKHRRIKHSIASVSVFAAAAVAFFPNSAKALEAYSALAFRNSIGVNSVLSETSATSRYDAIKAALRDIGIVNIRAKLTPANAGRARDLYQSSGVKTLARIDFRVGGKITGRADPSAIAQGVNTALSVGSQAIVGFEGPNEYTNHQHGPGWDDDLRDYMRRLSDEVRDRRLPQPIIGPTIYLRVPGDIRQLGDISNIIDASNFHIYTSGNEPSYRMGEWLSDARIMAPGKPVWVTEYGYHNAMKNPSQNPVSEVTAAKYLPRFASIYFSRDPQGKFFIFELVDAGTNPADREQNLGLMRSNLAKKPAFHALRRMIDAVKSGSTQVNPRDLAVQINGQSNMETLLLQKSDKEYALLLWQEVKSWDVKSQRQLELAAKPVTVTLPSNATFSLYDTLPFENDPDRDAAPEQFGGPRRSVTVNVPDHVVILQMKLS